MVGSRSTGAIPTLFLRLIEAPCFNNNCLNLYCSRVIDVDLTAVKSGVSPKTSCVFTSAPFCIRYSAISKEFLALAGTLDSKVLPNLSLVVMSKPIVSTKNFRKLIFREQSANIELKCEGQSFMNLLTSLTINSMFSGVVCFAIASWKSESVNDDVR